MEMEDQLIGDSSECVAKKIGGYVKLSERTESSKTGEDRICYAHTSAGQSSNKKEDDKSINEVVQN